jgi:hypothetical protein
VLLHRDPCPLQRAVGGGDARVEQSGRLAGRPAEASAAYLDYARLDPAASDAAQLTERANLLRARVASQ